MPKNKDTSAPKGSEGTVCLLGRDTDAHRTSSRQVQYLAARHGLSFHRAMLIAPIAFGVTSYV